MKKLLVFLLAFAMIFAMAACTSNTPEPAAPAEPAEPAAPAETTEPAAPAEPTAADVWPEKDLTLIIPWAAGGGTDLIGRQIAAQLEQILGVNVIVENVTGAGGAVGFKACADAEADGYTFTMATPSMLLQKYSGSTFVPYENLDHIAIINNDECCLLVNANAPYKTLSEFVEYAKAHPGELTCSNSGTGAIWNIIALQFEQKIGTTFIHVPYDSGTNAAVAVGGGHADMCMVSAAEANGMVEAGQAIMLAIGSEAPDDNFPGVKTFVEQGVDFVNGTWRDFAFPAGTDEGIKAKFTEALEQVYESEEFRTFMKNGRYGLQWKSGDEFASYLEESDKSYEELFKTISTN